MEETCVRIPEITEEDGWQPPVLEKRSTRPRSRCSDIFFAQYAVCILLVTGLLTLRVWDDALYSGLVERFCAETTAPSEIWAEEAAGYLRELWS